MNDERPIGKLYEWAPSTVRVGVTLTLVSASATVCGIQLECGGSCCLAPGHDGECSCCGDDAEPGDCPA